MHRMNARIALVVSHTFALGNYVIMAFSLFSLTFLRVIVIELRVGKVLLALFLFELRQNNNDGTNNRPQSQTTILPRY